MKIYQIYYLNKIQNKAFNNLGPIVHFREMIVTNWL